MYHHCSYLKTKAELKAEDLTKKLNRKLLMKKRERIENNAANKSQFNQDLAMLANGSYQEKELSNDVSEDNLTRHIPVVRINSQAKIRKAKPFHYRSPTEDLLIKSGKNLFSRGESSTALPRATSRGMGATGFGSEIESTNLLSSLAGPEHRAEKSCPDSLKLSIPRLRFQDVARTTRISRSNRMWSRKSNTARLSYKNQDNLRPSRIIQDLRIAMSKQKIGI